jgi:hypothetical protein
VVLLVDMIQAKTRIKLLRHFGIVLMALPEPITTPFGVALVLVSRYLSRRLEARLNKRLRETVKYYLAHTGCFSGDADGESSATGSVKRHTQSEEHLVRWQHTGSHSFEANIDPSVWQSWRDMRRRTVHHTMDMQSLSQYYGMRDNCKVEPRDPHPELTSGSTEKLMHHSIDMQSLSRRYKAGDSFKVESGWSDTSSRAEKVIHHTINMECLSRDYEGEDITVAHSNWARRSGAAEGVAHHSVNMGLLSQRYKTSGVEQVPIQHHTINMALLLHHYGPAATSMTVLKPTKIITAPAAT